MTAGDAVSEMRSWHVWLTCGCGGTYGLPADTAFPAVVRCHYHDEDRTTVAWSPSPLAAVPVHQFGNEVRRWWNGRAEDTPEGMTPPSKYDQENYPDGRRHLFSLPIAYLEPIAVTADA